MKSQRRWNCTKSSYDARDALLFHAQVRRGETEFSAYVDYELMNVALYDLFRW